MRGRVACWRLGIAASMMSAVFLSWQANGAEKTPSQPARGNRQEGCLWATSEQRSSGPRQAAWLDEISEIRRRLGMDLYKGTSLEDAKAQPGVSSREEFREALRQVAQAMSARSKPSSMAVGGRNARSEQTCRPSAAQDDRFVRALREAGRMLDERANQLAPSGDSGHAARLRKLAESLRAEARVAQDAGRSPQADPP